MAKFKIMLYKSNQKKDGSYPSMFKGGQTRQG